MGVTKVVEPRARQQRVEQRRRVRLAQLAVVADLSAEIGVLAPRARRAAAKLVSLRTRLESLDFEFIEDIDRTIADILWVVYECLEVVEPDNPISRASDLREMITVGRLLPTE